MLGSIGQACGHLYCFSNYRFGPLSQVSCIVLYTGLSDLALVYLFFCIRATDADVFISFTCIFLQTGWPPVGVGLATNSY